MVLCCTAWLTIPACISSPRILHLYYSRQSIFCLLSFACFSISHYVMQGTIQVRNNAQCTGRTRDCFSSTVRISLSAGHRSPGRSGVWLWGICIFFPLWGRLTLLSSNPGNPQSSRLDKAGECRLWALRSTFAGSVRNSFTEN